MITNCEQNFYTTVPEQLRKMAELLEKIHDDMPKQTDTHENNQ